MPHPPPCIWACPHDQNLQPLYLHYFYNATLRNYFTNLHKRGRGGPPALPAQRACNSESGMCTSMASSGSPGSSGVKHKVEQSESDCGSLKVRGCSSSIMDAHSCGCHCGLISSLVLPCPGIASLDGSSGFVSTLHLSFYLLMFIPLWLIALWLNILLWHLLLFLCGGIVGPAQEAVSPVLHKVVHLLGGMWHKFCQHDHHFSSAQLRLLVTPQAGTHSTSSLAELYTRMLPSKVRAHAMHK